MLRHSASYTIAPDIFDTPNSRSTNVIGTSTTVKPLRTARRSGVALSAILRIAFIFVEVCRELFLPCCPLAANLSNS